jgi:hypothetical protein
MTHGRTPPPVRVETRLSARRPNRARDSKGERGDTDWGFTSGIAY